MTVALAIGTLKGGWIARTDDRVDWQLDGPFLKGWQVSTFGLAGDGTFLGATGSTWFGAALHRSADLEEWDQIVSGPAYSSDAGRKLEQIWTLAPNGQRIYAGVAEAGLFVSDDHAATWQPVAGLNEHETRDAWQPGLGGLAAHRVLVDPERPERMWIGISAVGVFATDDAGVTWELRNDGVVPAAPSNDFDIGYCVHCLVADPEQPDTIWRQDHRGVYRTTNGAKSWERIEVGIPGGGFGFPIDRDSASGSLFIVPLESDQYRMPVGGEFAVYRSADGGDTWSASGAWPGSFTGVLRDAMSTDGDGGVYVGTTGGRIVYTDDAGDSWTELPWTLPRIVSTHVFTV